MSSPFFVRCPTCRIAIKPRGYYRHLRRVHGEETPRGPGALAGLVRHAWRNGKWEAFQPGGHWSAVEPAVLVAAYAIQSAGGIP